MDDISCGEKVLVCFKYSTCTTGLPPWSTTLKGHDSISFLTVGSSNLRPMRRLEKQLAAGLYRGRRKRGRKLATYLMSKMVFAGFMAAWFFADSPINLSSSLNETKDGVVKLPCSLATVSPLSEILMGTAIGARRTDIDIGAFIVGDARVCGT